MIITAVIAFAVLFCCNSCRTSKTTETSYTETSSDSTIHHTTDSVFISITDNSTDSLVTNTVVYVTLDSIGNEIKRVEYHDTYRSRLRDTEQKKASVKTDTLYKTKYKMINSTLYRTVIREATLSILQESMMTAGGIAIIASIIFLMTWIWKKRSVLHDLF